MPYNTTTGVFTRTPNSFSNPVTGTIIDPDDADELMDDYDLGFNSIFSVVETDVASAATTNIGAAATARVRITGSTGPITSFGTSANRLRFVTFNSTPTITHNATTLILPGGANIVAAANDTAIFKSDASGNWICVSYKVAASTTAGGSSAPTPPQGRISLTSGTPITTSDVAGATTHYYLPAPGDYIPLTTDGSTFTMQQFFEMSQSTTDATKSPAAVANNSIYDILNWIDTSTVTVTIASPAVFTWTSHGLLAGMAITFTTTGAMPVGITAGPIYYVIAAGLTANAFQVSTAVGGSAVDTSGSQSGVHTATVKRSTRGPAWASDTSRGTGAGTAQIDFATKFPTNKVAITNGPGANLGVLVGSIRSNGSAQLTDSHLFRWVSNIYNAVPRSLYYQDTGANHNYTTATIRQWNADAAAQIDMLFSLTGGNLIATAGANALNTGTAAFSIISIGIDSTSVNSAQITMGPSLAVATMAFNNLASYVGYPGIGRHTAVMQEYSSASGTTTWVGGAGGLILPGIAGWMNG